MENKLDLKKNQIKPETEIKNNSFSYNQFILHYVHLTKDLIDGIIIGSELKGITSLGDEAIQEFINLADQTRGIIGPNKIITYAADWSEYHSHNGNFHMDNLWAAKNIDVVGIDAYFPLTNNQNYSSNPTKEEIKAGWTSGEGYDYFYSDPNKEHKIYYDSPKYAWKNIDYWWNNYHINLDGHQTKWLPQMKPIWFTEYGFPSVHNATNMPNIFYNPASQDSGLPIYSNGSIDLNLQRIAIEATLEQWKNSPMVQQLFLWCYDARPYPYFPILRHIWSDSDLWIYGHWVNGKLGKCLLARILENLLSRVSLDDIKINTEQIFQSIDGFIINNNQTILESIEILQQSYFFDVIERQNEIKFLTRGTKSALVIPEGEILLINNEVQLKITKPDIFDLPASISLNFISNLNDYEVRTVQINKDDVMINLESGKIQPRKISNDILNIDLPIIITIAQAEAIANSMLHNLHYSADNYEINLPLKYVYLESSDVIRVKRE